MACNCHHYKVMFSHSVYLTILFLYQPKHNYHDYQTKGFSLRADNGQGLIQRAIIKTRPDLIISYSKSLLAVFKANTYLKIYYDSNANARNITSVTSCWQRHHYVVSGLIALFVQETWLSAISPCSLTFGHQPVQSDNCFPFKMLYSRLQAWSPISADIATKLWEHITIFTKGRFPESTQCWDHVALTSLKRHDVASTLMRQCLNVKYIINMC